MYLITANGRTYKSNYSAIDDKVRILNWNFHLNGLITEQEWAKSMQTINERFSLNMFEQKIDGRTKKTRQYPYFSWYIVLNPAKKY